ncbi:helix-turn-helix transcriptional regulator [Leucobacter coleopterorum]|uniref:Helix-turn-helix transcriptional regulator n=1 Tax=Leucobacter coleopterorum TaxID=2714933 RepID=A0ABX6JZZ5_9MICO|nr:helix-turn-helix transcriptional regulator [Leucobacter coleopterorum]QIM18529.1 helix-turn-helix transcriptional regulator [Leucobacter coleopterorum]
MSIAAPVQSGLADGLRMLLGAAGNGALLAELVGVTPAQVTRWKQGRQVPSADAARTIMDFAYIVTRAESTMHSKVVPIWLDSPNQFLRGSTPASVSESVVLQRLLPQSRPKKKARTPDHGWTAATFSLLSTCAGCTQG